MKRKLILLGIIISGILSIVISGNAYAAYPNYTLRDGLITISGSLPEKMTADGKPIVLEPGVDTQITVRPDVCPGGIEQKVTMSVHILDGKVQSVPIVCNDRGTRIIAEYEESKWYQPGVTTVTTPTTPTPRPPGSGEVGKDEVYTFVPPSGNTITACGGMFTQFAEASDGCITLSPDLDETGVEAGVTTWISRVTASRAACGSNPRTSTFYLTLDEPRVLTEGGELAGSIRNSGNQCDVELKGSGLSAIPIIVEGADKLDDLLGGSVESEEDPSGSLCQVEGGLSWLLCPVMNTMAMINDNAWNAIEHFLVLPPMMTTGDNNQAFELWKVVRNIANVLFVIVFLVVIYSQLTSFGITNYGIKKVLPRLIIGAILVNASFLLVALAVDLSNVIGSSIYKILDSGADIKNELTFVNATGAVLGNAALGGVAIGGAVMAGFSVLFPLAVSGLFMLVGLMFVLTFRHAMVFMLAIVAPLAFVAYLLPNTEGIFKSWFKTLRVLLYIYPAVAFIMGVSSVAAMVVFAAAQSMDNGLAKLIMMLMAVGMPVMAIFAALMLARTMGSMAGKLGLSNPLGGIINAAKDGAGKLGKRFDDKNATAILAGTKNPFKRVAGFGARRRAKFDAANSAAERNRALASQSYIAEQIGKNDGDNRFASRLASGAGDSGKMRIVAEAKAVVSKELATDIENIMSTLDKEVASNPIELEARFNNAVATDNLAEMAAYQKLMVRNGSPGVTKARESLTNFTDTSGLAGKELEKRQEQIKDMKDILSGDDHFQRAGRDFEVWSNNEHSQGSGEYRKDAAGNLLLDENKKPIEIKVPHTNFGAVTNDSSVWSSISAQRFASMNQSSQMLMLDQFAQRAASDTSAAEAFDRFIKRMKTDPTALGQVKDSPREIIDSHIQSLQATQDATSQNPTNPGS